MSTRSEKRDKQLANRSFRRHAKILISNRKYDDAATIHKREITDIYSFNKDGKKRLFIDRHDDFYEALRK